jgi:opacity protein-like surface antigen
MKIRLIALLVAGFTAAGYAQDRDSVQVDTAVSVKGNKKPMTIIKIGGAKIRTAKSDSSQTYSSKFSFQFTFSRIDLGLATFLDKGSFTLSPENSFLEHERWKTNNVGFEFLQTGYRFNSYFKIYLAAGLDWTHIRLKNDVTIEPNKPVLTATQESINFEKNRFSATYLRVPLSFQLRTKDDKSGNKFYFVAGPEVGFLINGKTKQVSDEEGKVKFKDDFNLNPFRYGAFARFGYDNTGLFVKYYANDVFADNQGPKDFKNLSFGLMFGF